MDKKYFDFDENLIKITEYTVLGDLPDPFLMDNGKRTVSKEDWEKRRKEIYKTAVEMQYGTIPPKPEVFRVQPLYVSEKYQSYKIHCGTKEKQLSFLLTIFAPEGVKNPPIVIDGDMCFPYPFISEYRNEFLDRNIAYATFNRCELADDIREVGRGHGDLYEIYSDYTFGALGAWAWGYSRAADALEEIGLFDLNYLAFTGHSRGAKTCMLAGVLDERAKIVNPNDSNGGSCGCYRVHCGGIREDGIEQKNETLDYMLEHHIGFWFGEEMEKYRKCEEKLPFDCHFLKALVAPRILLVGEAASDLNTNIIGSWQTSLAAKEVYKFLGCEDNLKWYFRKGFHYHRPEDAAMLANLICSLQGKEELYPYYYKIPFKPVPKIWDWEI